MLCELQDLPVSSEVAAAVGMTMRFFSSATLHERERQRRIGNAEDHVDVLVVVPALGDADADIDLVLEIGGHQLDRLAEHRAAEIGDGELDRGDVARPGVVGVEAGHVVQHADLHGVVLGQRRGAEQAAGQ